MNIEVNEVEKIREIIAEILEVEVSEVEMDTDLVEELDADSMMALEIMATIENEMGVKISEKDFPKFGTLREILDVINTVKSSKLYV